MGEGALVAAHRRIQTTSRELRGQLTVLVMVLWTVAAFNTATSGMRLMSGQIKGTDFLHFYALARVGATEASEFANPELVRAAQLRAVPQSGDHIYPPVYGPQVAVALAPLARVGYGAALALWVALSAAMYFASVAVVLYNAAFMRRYLSIGLLAAAGFPPFWYLLQYGQLSAVALCLIVISSTLLRRGQGVAAGAALGLLIYKPPLFAPIFAIVLLGGSWTIAAAMLVSGAAEVMSTALWVGLNGLEDYVQLVLRLPSMAAMMAAKPDQMHSLRAFWSLPFRESAFSLPLYGVTAIAVMLAAAYVWRRATDPSLRMAALLLGTVLASPHFYVYDLVILAPAWVWLTEWYMTQPLPRSVGRALYVGYLAAFFGHVATVLPIQLSVLCFAYLLVSLWRWAPNATALGNSEHRASEFPGELSSGLPSARGVPILSP